MYPPQKRREHTQVAACVPVRSDPEHLLELEQSDGRDRSIHHLLMPADMAFFRRTKKSAKAANLLKNSAW